MRDPRSLGALLDRLRESVLQEIRVAMPARVVSFDAARGLIEAQPLLKEDHGDESGQLLTDPLPPITDVPVVFPGAGGFRLTFPVAAGDVVLLLFTDRSLDRWLSGVGGTDPVDPVDVRRHALSDAVAIPGLRMSATNSWTGISPDGVTLGKDGGLQVAVKNSTIELGGAVDSVALASKVDTQLNALKTAIQAWVPVPTDGGAALKIALTALFATWPTGVGSATIKGKD